MIYDVSLRMPKSIIPKNKPIWAVAYKINPETGNHALYSKPVKGEFDGNNFRPYNKHGELSTNRVSCYSRILADTEEEATRAYNELINRHIDRLQDAIEKAKADLIPEITDKTFEQHTELHGYVPMNSLVPLIIRQADAMTPFKTENIKLEYSDDNGITWHEYNSKDEPDKAKTYIWRTHLTI